MNSSLHQKKDTRKKRPSNTQRILSMAGRSLKAQSEKKGKGSVSELLRKTTLVRILIACILLVATLITEPADQIRTAFMLIAVLFAGCDIFSEAIKKSTHGDIFSYSSIITVSTIIALILGYSYEAVVMIVLYRICIYLVSYTINKTKLSAIDLIDPNDADIVSYTSDILNEPENLHLDIEDTLNRSSRNILRISIVVAVLYALLLPLLAHYTYKAAIYRALSILLVSVPFSVTASVPAVASVGLGFAASKGSIFKNAAILEKIRTSRLAVFNDGKLNNDEQPTIISVETAEIDEDTFLNLVSNLVYDSEQWFARAIVAAHRYNYLPGLIKNFDETEGSGIEGEINGSKVYFGTAEYVEDHCDASQIQEELDGDYFHLVISGRYIGSLVLSRNYETDPSAAIEGLKERGVAKCVLLSPHSLEFSEVSRQKPAYDGSQYNLSQEQISEALNAICMKGRYKKLYISAEDSSEHSSADFDVKLGLVSVNEDATVIPEYLDHFPESFDISARMSEVAKENALFVFIIKAVLIFLAMIGFSSIWFAVFIDLAAALATILNAIRVISKPLLNLSFLRKL